MPDEAVCRSCGASLQLTFLDLGRTPLANAYPSSVEEAARQPTYPLCARVCHVCTLVQLDHSVDPAVLFGDYAYFSSYSDSWLQHSSEFAEWAIRESELSEDSSIVEVASNDGYLLQHFVARGMRVLGVEPAANVAKVAIERGVPTDIRFFGRDVASDLVERGHDADLVIGNNVIAHVPDLNDFVAGLSILLKERGVVSLEFPHLLRLIDQVQFDTIYHEHFSYFSLHSLEQVLRRHDLEPFDVHQLQTHGGSLRVLAGRSGSRRPDPGVTQVRQAEVDAGLRELGTYEGFRERVEDCKRSLLQFLAQTRAEGREVVGYGAAAKGNTLLNYCGVTANDVSYVVDRNPNKTGRLMPGSAIPIHSPERIRETKPPYILILPWNLKKEVSEQMAFAREWNARFVTPIPQIEIF